ncbi:hypothetical protein J6590_047499 [Homalodisca vitripennis]|nr:hypothetical protein J6590_047499 [Homalodisca vitripennis]
MGGLTLLNLSDIMRKRGVEWEGKITLVSPLEPLEPRERRQSSPDLGHTPVIQLRLQFWAISSDKLNKRWLFTRYNGGHVRCHNISIPASPSAFTAAIVAVTMIPSAASCSCSSASSHVSNIELGRKCLLIHQQTHWNLKMSRELKRKISYST